MKRILAQARKEIMHFHRDRLIMALSVLMPAVMIWIFGVTIALDPDNINLAILDHDRTPASRAYADAYAAGSEFVVVPGRLDADPRAPLDSGEATAVLVIPPGFERRLESLSGGEVQLLLDGSDANTALILRQEAEAIHQSFLSARAGRPDAPLSVDVRFWYNPGLSDRVYSGTGALAIVLIFFPALLGATAASREHELGTIIQVYASSLTVHEWAIGKALPHIVIGLSQFVLCFAIGKLWFSYRVPSDPVPLLLGTLCYITIGVLFGMWVGTQTKSQSASIQIVQLGVFLVSLLLSGFLTPLASMPVQLRWVSQLIPATYYVDLVRDALLRNAGWPTMWSSVLVLGVLVLVLYWMIIFQMRRMRLPTNPMRPHLPRALERYWALTRKEFQQVRRNGKMMIQLTIPPTFLLLVLGYALNPEVKDLRVAVVDMDGGRHARELAAELDTLSTFDITRRFYGLQEADRAMARRQVDMALVFPPNLSRDLDAGRPAAVQAIVDAVPANSAAVAAGHLHQIFGRYGAELVIAAPPGAEPPQLRPTTIYNPGLVFRWYYLTGLISIIMFVDGSLVASAVAVREKEIGTIEQLLMSPAQSVEIILAKTTPVIVLLVTGLLIARGTAQLWFGLPLRGSFWLFLLGGILAAVSAVGIGTLIGTFVRTQQQAQFLTFFINPPAVFLSGAFTRLENMPEAFQAASVFMPLRYFVTIVRDVSIKGAGLDLLWDDLAILGAMGVLLYLASAWRFRKQL